MLKVCKGRGGGIYPEGVVEGLGCPLAEVKLVSEFSFLGLHRSHQFLFCHFFSGLETKIRRPGFSCGRETVDGRE